MQPIAAFIVGGAVVTAADCQALPCAVYNLDCGMAAAIAPWCTGIPHRRIPTRTLDPASYMAVAILLLSLRQVEPSAVRPVAE
jgi:hypothetical protein